MSEFNLEGVSEVHANQSPAERLKELHKLYETKKLKFD